MEPSRQRLCGRAKLFSENPPRTTGSLTGPADTEMPSLTLHSIEAIFCPWDAKSATPMSSNLGGTPRIKTSKQPLTEKWSCSKA